MARRLPIGVQEFEIIRNDNCLYVDKTDLVYHLVKNYYYCFFSRPRRFGKSLLISTIEAYFKGRKELFEGLKIMDLETEWKCYPVLRFTMPNGGYDNLEAYLSETLTKYEKQYNLSPTTTNLSARFGTLLITIAKKTNSRVVVLIDEYDAPLQNTLYQPGEHERCRDLYRTFFTYLKTEQLAVKFVFITGVSKFTQLSLFSSLNNLSILSQDPCYETLCGITEEELHTCFEPEIEKFSTHNGWTINETYDRLKKQYDGYHFSNKMTDIYNPYSLLKALKEMYLDDYWVSSGSTKVLVDYFDYNVKNIPELENVPIDASRLRSSDMDITQPSIFMFQTGYLTIKDYCDDEYILGIPNREVSKAIYENLLPRIVNKDRDNVDNCIFRIKRALRQQNVDAAMLNLQQLVAETPYTKQQTDSALEEYFNFILRQVFFLCGYEAQSEVVVSHGIIDLVVKTPLLILLFELKTVKQGGIAAAKQQIIDRGYTQAFAADQRPTIAIAVAFDTEKKQMDGYEIVQ